MVIAHGRCLFAGALLLTCLAPLQALGECGDRSSWSPLELHAWNALTEGDEFDALKTVGSDLRKRLISPKFIRSVLTCSVLSKQLGPKGLVLRGVVVPAINLNFVKVPIRFVCTDCLIEKMTARRSEWQRQVKLDNTEVSYGLDLSHAIFKRGVRGVRLKVNNEVKFDQSRVTEGLSLSAANIGASLSVAGASIAGNMHLDGATLGALNASGARVSNQLILSGIGIARQAVLDRMRIGGDLLLRSYANAPRLPTIGHELNPDASGDDNLVLNLNSARIDGRIEFAAVTINGDVSLDAVKVGTDIWIRERSRIEGSVAMPFARIGQNLDLSSSQFKANIDATGATIKGELRLGSYDSTRLSAPEWSTTARLILRNASVSAWLDAYQDVPPEGTACGSEGRKPDPWPCRIDITGFSYTRIGGLGGGDEFQRSTDWFLDWLARQHPFSLDPYRRLAIHLESDGRDATARAVRYAGKEAQLSNAEGMEWFLLFVQKIFVGYGIFTGVVFVWVAGLVALGAAIFSRTPEARESEIPISIAFSIDMLIPVVQLRARHTAIDFEGPVRFYLYFHKFMGWVCALFYVTALSGLFEV